MAAAAHPRDHRHGHRERHAEQQQRGRVVAPAPVDAGGGEQEREPTAEDDHAREHRDHHLDVVADEVERLGSHGSTVYP